MSKIDVLNFVSQLYSECFLDSDQRSTSFTIMPTSTSTPITPQNSPMSNKEVLISCDEIKTNHEQIKFSLLLAPKLKPTSHEGRVIPFLKI